MEKEGSSREEEDKCPPLLDLICQNREWFVDRNEIRSHGFAVEKSLELRLGLPGQEWTVKNNSTKSSSQRDESFLSLGYFSSMSSVKTQNHIIQKTQKFSSSENQVDAVCQQGKLQQNQRKQKSQPCLQFPSTPRSLPVLSKEVSHACCNKAVELQDLENEAFLPSSLNAVVPHISQKRSAPAPVVGWPPIRSFRKNLASTSSTKPYQDSRNNFACEKPSENGRKIQFVKINMDGVPIGRKVDLNAYDSYQKLSSAVDKLFRDLLAAQKDSSASVIKESQQEEREMTGLLVGSGEYTLVYADNVGDQMLVGDVPWHMFMSTVKRIRVLKSSELSALNLGSRKAKQLPVEK